MSSYASIAAENAPSKAEQPKPDPGYLEGHNSHEDVSLTSPDVNSHKVTVVPADSDLEHLKTQSQDAYNEAVANAREQRRQLEAEAKRASNDAQKVGQDVKKSADQAGKDVKNSADKAATDAQKVGKDVKNNAKSAANDAQKKGEKLAGDAQKKGEEVAEEAQKKGGELADKADRLGHDAKKEAQKASKKASEYYEQGKKEVQKDAEILRKKGEQGAKKVRKAANDAEHEIESFWDSFSRDPKQWGPTLAAVNVALLGGLGIYAYTNQDQVRRTDRRLLSAATVGILGLLGGQYTWATETARKQNRGL